MKIDGRSVSQEVRDYVRSVVRELNKEHNKKLQILKCSFNRRLNELEDKISNFKNIDLPQKCQNFIQEKPLIVSDIENSFQFYS